MIIAEILLMISMILPLESICPTVFPATASPKNQIQETRIVETANVTLSMPV